MTSGMAWLRRRDPHLATVRRAARVMLVACAGFYLCRYVLGNLVMAPYALFTAIALGLLSQISGSPRRRAGTLLAVLPFGWALITVGTLLSFNTWAAAAGMFVFGFLVSFAGVGGPRLVGLAAGGQLLYILPCFPPYDPGSLGWRLAGVTLAALLLAAAELVLWPDPAPVPYRTRLAAAVSALASCLEAVADTWSGDPTGRDRLAVLLPAADEAAEALRPSRLPPIERPASAGRRDRALSAAAGTTRLLLGRVADLYAEDEHDAVAVPAAAALVREAAGCAEAAAAWLRGEGEAPDTGPMSRALQLFRLARMKTDPQGLPPERLRLGSLALSLGEWVHNLVTAVRIVAGEPLRPDATPEPFWYAYEPSRRLWWHRLRENLTPRSVHFQGALRLAAALAAARLLVGLLDLSHGFWVLLTVLTVLRTSAAATRSTFRPALAGTVVGSLIAAVVLLAPLPPTAYAFALPVIMLAGFAAGPLLGLGWSQAFFSLTITFVFAQLAPVDWRLAEARVLDVAVGAAIGVAIGLFAWPRGASGELHRATGIFLADAARVVRDTVDVLAKGQPPGRALATARADGRLADASYALYQSEPAHTGRVDWQATIAAGHHAVRGAEALIRSCPSGGLLPCVTQLTVSTTDVAGRYEHTALALLLRDPAVAAEPAAPPPALDWPDDLGQDLYHLADLRVWLDGLRDDLARVSTESPAPAAAPQAEPSPARR